jgi:LPS sulfotransferase NodH
LGKLTTQHGAVSVATEQPVAANSKDPFFILGCVRSGTTLLRDVLRIHPALECPEETHIFRWSDPFKSPRYLHPYKKNKDLREQRKMDGVSEDDFVRLIDESTSKSNFAANYGNHFLAANNKPDARWFDKTPQNIYGILLISAQMPEAKFIHIYRNPLNVVASLFEGKVMEINDLYGAANYWLETMQIMSEYKKIGADRVLEVAYESLSENPEPEIARILDFVGEDQKISLPEGFVHRERNHYRRVLNRQQIASIKDICAPYYAEYGYDSDL